MKTVPPEFFLDPQKHIPKGPYCYYGAHFGTRIPTCRKAPMVIHHLNKMKDWEETGSLLWDQCKECGINWEDEDDHIDQE